MVITDNISDYNMITNLNIELKPYGEVGHVYNLYSETQYYLTEDDEEVAIATFTLTFPNPTEIIVGPDRLQSIVETALNNANPFDIELLKIEAINNHTFAIAIIGGVYNNDEGLKYYIENKLGLIYYYDIALMNELVDPNEEYDEHGTIIEMVEHDEQSGWFDLSISGYDWTLRPTLHEDILAYIKSKPSTDHTAITEVSQHRYNNESSITLTIEPWLLLYMTEEDIREHSRALLYDGYVDLSAEYIVNCEEYYFDDPEPEHLNDYIEQVIAAFNTVFPNDKSPLDIEVLANTINLNDDKELIKRFNEYMVFYMLKGEVKGELVGVDDD